MADQSYLLGRKAVAYFNEQGTLLAPDFGGATSPKEAVENWLNLTQSGQATLPAENMVDVSLNIDSEYSDGTTRETAATGFASQIPVLRGGEVTFEARWKPAATDASKDFTQILMEAWEQDKPIAMVFLDQPWDTAEHTTGDVYKTQGLASNFSVSLGKTENLRDVQRMSVSLTIADSALWFIADNRTGTG